MKSIARYGAVVLTGLCVLLGNHERLTAQSHPAHYDRTRYKIVNLGALEGNYASGNTINYLNWVMGSSTFANDSKNLHATVWAYGHKFDLGTLGGPNSSVQWPVKNERGLIAGISETAAMQPHGEHWSCADGFFFTLTNHVCVGFRWRDGWMQALPTLGGDNGFAEGVNNRDQIVGWAETRVRDSTCYGHQVLQFEAVLYEPDGRVVELAPLGNDLDGAATAINNRGEVVGISGTCGTSVGGDTAKHAVVWRHGVPTDLGELGGVAWNTPTAINDRGEITGFLDSPGDSAANPNFQAVLWTREGITQLHTLEGDALSSPGGINERGQIVGVSYGSGFAHPRAFLWQKGKIADLNNLVVGSSTAKAPLPSRKTAETCRPSARRGCEPPKSRPCSE